MSSDEIRLAADRRTQFGKGAARKLRRAHMVPAVLYGHGEAPAHLALPFHDTFQALKNPNALLTIAVDGEGDQLALAKDVQRDPVKPIIEHVDLVIVKRGEKVTVEVPVVAEGEPAPGGNLLEHVLNALPVEAEATHIPESFTVSVEGLEAGASILAKDVALPGGCVLAVEEDAVVIQVVAAQIEVAEEAEEGAEGAEAAAEEAPASEG